MRWIRFETHGHAAYGIVEGDKVTEVRGDPFAGYEKTATRHKLCAVKLLVPVDPRTFYCAGLNYAEHVIEAARSAARSRTCRRPPISAIAPTTRWSRMARTIVIPKDATELVQYEGELVAVIGNKAKHLSRAGRALLRARLDHRQRHERAHLAAPATAPCGGPRTPTRSSRWGRGSRPISTSPRRTRSSASTARKRSASRPTTCCSASATFISRMSQYMTLYPGDVVWMGTEGAPENVKHGDTIEIEITGIGILSNPVVREGM